MTPANDGGAAYLGAFTAGLKPDPPLWVDEWSEAHMVIPPESGAAEPGPYRGERTPYARAVMRSLSPDDPCKRVVVKGASQLLKTQVGLNWIAALIDQAPANIIVLLPTDKLAKRVSARVDKSIEAMPCLKAKVAAKRSRDNANTLDTKAFRGGTLWILTGRSASNLSEATARYVYVDEIDRLLRELKGEGDPVSLVEKRASTFGRNAKFYYTSSPTEAENSRIDELYQEGDQRRFYVPCPQCGERQTLEWENLVYDAATGTAVYACVNGCLIEEHNKTAMLVQGHWKAHAAGDGETHSYTLSALYAPLGWVSWATLGKEHAQAKDALSKGDSWLMQVFWNTRLALVWSSASSRAKPEELKAKAEPYAIGIAPDGAAIVTASVDVQFNRLEVQIVGWGHGPCGLECWVINTHVIIGNPALEEPWIELDAILLTPVRHVGGVLLPIRAACVDTGGDHTHEVYEFCRARRKRWIMGQEQAVLSVKGASKPGRPLIGNKPSKLDINLRGKVIKDGAELWLVGTDTGKAWIYNRLELADKTAIHTPEGLPLEFYEQLLSENKITEIVRGRKVTKYVKKKSARNEQLDLLNYNLAAASYLGLERYTAEMWGRFKQKQKQAELFSDGRESAPEPVAVATPSGRVGGINKRPWRVTIPKPLI